MTMAADLLAQGYRCFDADLFATAVAAAGGRPSPAGLQREAIGPLVLLAGATDGALVLHGAAEVPAMPAGGAPLLLPAEAVTALRAAVEACGAWASHEHEGGVVVLVPVLAAGEPEGELWLLGDEALPARFGAVADLVALACDLIGAAAALAGRRAGTGTLDRLVPAAEPAREACGRSKGDAVNDCPPKQAACP